ncbi:hypothetical protein TrST_g12643 [Triparma strigata]|uniref:Uncharacterized protein n=1 Tax=Triparma strigata TaxID=1606541 RepID=A0A9W7EZ31_9STRA|nr:hypothetical protein TrST_g12643 [Triparma strigata]
MDALEMELEEESPHNPPLDQSQSDNLDTSPLTPALMKSAQYNYLSSKIPTPYSSKIASLFSSNLTRDDVSLPRFLDSRSSSAPYFKFLKFLLITYTGMYTSRSFAKKYGSTWDPDLNLTEFIDHNFWDTITDVTLIYFLGRYNYRRGVDCLNYILPMFFGACIWELLGKNPELSQNLSDFTKYTALTYVVFISFIFFVLLILVLHLYKMHNDKILPSRTIEMVLILSLTLGPLIGNPNFHLHHWTWAWLGCLVFNLRYSWSWAMQGFMMGMYVNGIGIWGRDSVLA